MNESSHIVGTIEVVHQEPTGVIALVNGRRQLFPDLDAVFRTAIGLLDEQGRDLPLGLQQDAGSAVATTRLLELRDEQARFEFDAVPCRPVPSLLRGFSAPVKLHYDYSDRQLMFLMAHDSDGFTRWVDGQYALDTPELGLSNWEGGRMLGRGGRPDQQIRGGTHISRHEDGLTDRAKTRRDRGDGPRRR